MSEANASTVLFLDASYWSRKAETGLCRTNRLKIASCRRQPCVPGCFSGHCDLAKPALRPPMFFRRLALISAVIFPASRRSDSRQCSSRCFLLVSQGRNCLSTNSLKIAPAEGSLASPDAFPGIATWRSLARFLPASRPGFLPSLASADVLFRRLASNFSSDWLSPLLS